MASSTSLYWLPSCDDWRGQLAALKTCSDEDVWARAVELAGFSLDAIQTGQLDRLIQQRLAAGPAGAAAGRHVRLALLASCTVSHLVPALRVAALRRGLWLQVFEPDYGQYMQELLGADSALAAFQPNEILFSLDAASLLGEGDLILTREAADQAVANALDHLRTCWRLARERFSASVIQQALLPPELDLLGAGEHRLAGSPERLVAKLNEAIRAEAEVSGIDLLPLDTWATRLGLDAWRDSRLWFKARQEIRGDATPLYGDLVGRILAARRGQSAKALVLDLDNTLWGGVVGDDGVDGLVLGQGDALGESFLSLQRYARDLARRGVILAVCSKNDVAVARSAFAEHPEMVLRLADISAFVANWDDKAQNIRAIATALNISLDALVFVDDNPFERELVRRELPQVRTPEVPEEPAKVARCLSDAGYFEALALTNEDLARTDQYRANAARVVGRAVAADLTTYLQDLKMVLHWGAFDEASLTRVVQLINKTNQFNLTTRRYDTPAVTEFRARADIVTLQFRLLDRFGDNGLIAAVIGRVQGDALHIDTWLMSCRVLGRSVEAGTLAVVAAEAVRRGLARLVGAYRPTAKNGMVSDHYEKLGFTLIGDADDGSEWELGLDGWSAPTLLMTIIDDGVETKRVDARV